jgi:hypothetical protein
MLVGCCSGRPSHEEGVPPPAAQSRAVREPPVVEQTAAGPTSAVVVDDDAPAADAPLPLGNDEFPDEVLAVVCRFLGLRGLGRLACVARRFTEPTLTEPGGGGGAGGAKLLSPIEEGARLRLAAAAASGGRSSGGGGGGASGGGVAVRLVGDTWLRALWRVESRLVFTSCGPEVVLSEEGALRLRAARRAAAGDMVLGCLGTRAGLHSLRSWLSELQRARGVLCVWCFACGRCCHSSLLFV